jgi:hypothetical protein
MLNPQKPHAFVTTVDCSYTEQLHHRRWEPASVEVRDQSWREGGLQSGRGSETALQMDGGDGCTILWMQLLPQNCACQKAENGKFYVMYILPHFQNFMQDILDESPWGMTTYLPSSLMLPLR